MRRGRRRRRRRHLLIGEEKGVRQRKEDVKLMGAGKKEEGGEASERQK